MGKLDWYRKSNDGKSEASSSCRGRHTSAGCNIGAVFQFFNFNHFRFWLHQSPSSLHLPHDTVLKGMEAPRNSLELASKEDQELPIPAGMRIRTRTSLSNDSSSEIIGGSPAANTPTLVARLMGLDLFPAPATPPPSVGNTKSRLHRRGTRSLPETPRVSSSSDRRLSLQADRNTDYAKQNVTKRPALMDITNTSVSRNRQHRRDQELLIRTQKSTTALPRLRLSENRTAAVNNSQTMPKQAKKTAGGGRLRSRLNKPPQTSDIMRKHKQEEPFVRPVTPNTRHHKNCKKTPLISSAVNVKKAPSSPATKFLVQSQSNKSETDAAQRSTQSSSFPSQKYDQATHNPDGGGAEYQYVTEILKRMRLQKDSSVNQLDPSIFNQLQMSHHHQATNTATRKLIFHLVDEMLVEIFTKPWSTCTSRFGHVKLGSELVDTLCTKMQSFPAKDCRTLEDIDTIIDYDLPEWKLRDVPRLAFEEEGESVAREIEEYVMDTLVLETASVVFNIGRFGERSLLEMKRQRT